MREKYIIGIDQSTQGTKAILLNASGEIAGKTFLPHEQIVNGEGWVSHDAEEIFRNVILTAGTLIGQMAIDKKSVAAIGISNQRETTVAWDRETGKPVEHAIVWQWASRYRPTFRLRKQRGSCRTTRRRGNWQRKESSASAR